MKLTERQEAVREYIRQFIADESYPPTVREIAHHFRISPEGARAHLEALEHKGALVRSPRIPRSIRVIDI